MHHISGDLPNDSHSSCYLRMVAMLNVQAQLKHNHMLTQKKTAKTDGTADINTPFTYVYVCIWTSKTL